MNTGRIDQGLQKEQPLARGRWLLAAILVLGLALRLINLGGRMLWYDEAFAILYSEKGLQSILHGTIAPVNGAAADVHPLLYYFILHFWQALLGGSVFAVRSLSVILGVLTIGLVYLVARELFGERVALVAALLTAVAPFDVNYSQETRMYSLLAALTLGMVWFFVRAWRGGGWALWAGFTLMGALSLYTQNLAFLNILAIDLWVIVTRRWRLIKPLVLCQLVMVILFLPWLSIVPSQLGKIGQAYWVPRPGLGELVRTVVDFTFNLPLPPAVLPGAVALSIGLLVLTLYRLFRCSLLSPEMALVLILSLGPLLMMFVLSQWRSVYIDRGILPAALSYYILLAAVWSGVRVPKWGAGLILLPFAAVVLVSLYTYYTYDLFPRSPYPQLVAFLRQQYRSGDVIVHDNKLSFFPSYYYDRELPQQFAPDPPGSGSDTLALPTQESLGLYATPLEEAVQGQSRVWFVIFQRAIDEYVKTGKSGHPDKLWLDEHYREKERRSFNDLDVYLYERN